MFLSEWREFPSTPCLAGGKKLDDSSRLDVVEMARVPDVLPSLFPSWSCLGLISTPVTINSDHNGMYRAMCQLRSVPVLSDVVVIFLISIVLTPNDCFWVVPL